MDNGTENSTSPLDCMRQRIGKMRKEREESYKLLKVSGTELSGED
jgi:hypothetical protein